MPYRDVTNNTRARAQVVPTLALLGLREWRPKTDVCPGDTDELAEAEEPIEAVDVLAAMRRVARQLVSELVKSTLLWAPRSVSSCLRPDARVSARPHRQDREGARRT